MDALEIIYDHYKDTFTLIKDSEKERNKIFIILCLLITGLYLLAIEPNSLYQVLRDLVKEYGKTNINFSIAIVQSLLWIVMLFYSMRYFQINSYIERQYNYLHIIEEEINEKIKFTFSREGKGYLDKYPMVLNLIYFIYTWVFPVIYMGIVLYKIILEWTSIHNIRVVMFDSLIAGCIILASFLYILLLHPIKIKTKLNLIKRIIKRENPSNSA
jgi:hypothetical protein